MVAVRCCRSTHVLWSGNKEMLRHFGLDKISARLLKDSVDVITRSLTNLQINIVNYLHECELQ